MQYILTHYGHQFARHLEASGTHARNGVDPGARACLELLAATVLPVGENGYLRPLVEAGLVETVEASVDLAAIRLRYERNPLEHVSRVVFEYTTRCNLRCLHCRNRYMEPQLEERPQDLRRVVEAMVPIGVKRFDFIGGEVTALGLGWLDVVSHARKQGADHVSVLTSGWFLGKRDFVAAGERYRDDVEYLAILAAKGVTHVVFSLDGREEQHDHWRQTPGLYRRVMEGFEKVRQSGMTARVSLVLTPGQDQGDVVRWLLELAPKVYGVSTRHPLELVARLKVDDSNYMSNFIDIGGAAQLRTAAKPIAQFANRDLRCKAFFRPSPTLRVKASGEISMCPLSDAGDGYGNVHERDVVDIVNHMHETVPYQLHASGRISTYRRLLDPALYAGRVSHVCTLRIALTMLARAIEEGRLDPDDKAALDRTNREIARGLGYHPSAPL